MSIEQDLLINNVPSSAQQPPAECRSLQRQLADKIVRFDHLDQVRMLLAAGANVNDPITQGLRPLHYAVYGNNADCCRLLLLRGCDIDGRDDVGYAAIHLAAERGNCEMLRLLLDNSATVNFYGSKSELDSVADYTSDEPLRLAIKNSHFECAEMLLKSGANPNIRYFLGPEITLLPVTDVLFIKLLLQYGADANAYSRDGLTPLMKACMKGDTAMASVHLLLRHGARVNAFALEKQDLRTPLHYAILSGSLTVVRYMIRHGAWVNMPDTYDRPTPLDLAVLKDRPDLVQTLLDHGANPNAVHTYIGSCMHLVVCSHLHNQYAIINALIKAGGNVNHTPFFTEGGNVKSPLAEYIRTQDEIDEKMVLLLLSHNGQVLIRTPAADPRGQARNLPKLYRNYPRLYELLVNCAQHIDAAAVRRVELPEAEKQRLIGLSQQPFSLQHLARLAVRRSVSLTHPLRPTVLSLPLPLHVKRVLLFQATC